GATSKPSSEALAVEKVAVARMAAAASVVIDLANIGNFLLRVGGGLLSADDQTLPRAPPRTCDARHRPDGESGGAQLEMPRPCCYDPGNFLSEDLTGCAEPRAEPKSAGQPRRPRSRFRSTSTARV